MVPQNDEEIKFDEAMAKVATELALERHSGYIENVYTPMGVVFNQIGKFLWRVGTSVLFRPNISQTKFMITNHIR